MNNKKVIEQEIAIHRNIYHNHSKVKQCDLTGITGLSQGMINDIIKPLITKGWPKAGKIKESSAYLREILVNL